MRFVTQFPAPVTGAFGDMNGAGRQFPTLIRVSFWQFTCSCDPRKEKSDENIALV